MPATVEMHVYNRAIPQPCTRVTHIGLSSHEPCFLLREPHSAVCLLRYGIVHLGAHGGFLASDVTVFSQDVTQFAKIQTQWANKVFESLLFLILAQHQFAHVSSQPLPFLFSDTAANGRESDPPVAVCQATL